MTDDELIIELVEALTDLMIYSDDFSSPTLYFNAVDRAKAALVRAKERKAKNDGR